MTRLALVAALQVALVASGACARPRTDGAADSAGGARGGTGGAAGGVAGDVAPATPGAPVAQGGAHVTIEVDRARYAPGGTVSLRITNRDDAGYGFTACTRTVERRQGSAWVEVPEEGRMCAMMLQLLGARQTVTVTTDLPSPLPAGEYRLVITFAREEGPAPGRDTPPPSPPPTRVASTTFRVD